MFKVTMIKPNVYEVVSYTRNMKKYWYYDIFNGKMNKNGIQGEVLDKDISEGTLQWVLQYYVPKSI